MFLVLAAALMQPLGQPPGQPPATQPPATQTPPPAPTTTPVIPPTSPSATQSPSQIGGKSLAEWLKELNDSKDAHVRELAVKAIPMFGPTAREPALKPLLKVIREDGDPGVRVNAILTMGSIGANSKEEAKMIVDTLKIAIANASPGGVIRMHASRAIASYGHYADQANDAVSTLTGIVKDPSWETRKSVAYALGRIGGPTKTKPPEAKPPASLTPVSPLTPPPLVDPKTGPDVNVLKTLIGMLGDSSATVRLEVVESLVLLGPPAISLDKYSTVVTPFMTAALERTKNEKDKSVQIWLQMFIMRFDGNMFNDPNIAKIVSLARGDSDAPIQAFQAMGMLGEKAQPHGIAFAREMIRHPEPLVVVAAATYLHGVGVPAKVAIPDLEQVLGTTKDEVLKNILQQTLDAVGGKKPTTSTMPVTPKK